ncbi:MAG TPA: hypothetical protein VGL53_01365 [Bryobacteraceae bacterium]
MTTGLSFLAITAFIVGAAGAETRGMEARVQVERASLAESARTAPKVYIEFRLWLANRGGDAIPFEGGGWSVSTVEARGADGKWIILMQGNDSLLGEHKFPQCGSLPPGHSAEVGGNPTLFFFHKERRTQLGNKLTLRMQVLAYCVGADGTTKLLHAWTEPFGLTVPESERPIGEQ